jgi:malate/lactate dehydrogenase
MHNEEEDFYHGGSMYYYKHKGKYLFSQIEYTALQAVNEEEAAACDEPIYYMFAMDPHRSRKSFCVSDPSLFQLKEENLQLLQLQQNSSLDLPDWILAKIAKNQIKAVNTSYKDWEACLETTPPNAWRINIVGLGDVGSTLLVGLKLLGADKISQIGIFDIDSSKVIRWEFEGNQILFPNQPQSPKILAVPEEELFNCDMFVFCVTVGIPALDSKNVDVRMAQFEGNSRIISLYAKKAREANFKGIFAVVSDPVDLLCKKALIQSNTSATGEYDFKGLAPEQIRGYGLGVMHGRAAYYAALSTDTKHYATEGRAFGPHGQHLIIADSIANYNDELSKKLTEQTRNANLELRKHGYKPYVAPALSSGAISILETLYGNWHYSATYIGGVYMGARNRLVATGTILEQNNIPEQLMNRLYESYKELERII